MREALSILSLIPAKRKIAVLGDMLEIGRYSEDAHRETGKRASEFVDVILTIGSQARFIGEEAKATRPKKQNKTTGEKVFSFANSISAGKMLQSLLRPGDLILIKGSQGMRMERIVEEIMVHPERAKELLVRQEAYWKN
jgi:UDP-N-acetylmuramoyl-tripeptide--D-alanyl-D-alanine ligase